MPTAFIPMQGTISSIMVTETTITRSILAKVWYSLKFSFIAYVMQTVCSIYGFRDCSIVTLSHMIVLLVKFSLICVIINTFLGYGSSKKEAKVNAATKLFNELCGVKKPLVSSYTLHETNNEST